MFDAIRVVEKAPSQIKNLVVGVFAADAAADENAKPAFDAAPAKVIAAAGGADNAPPPTARAEVAGSFGNRYQLARHIGCDTGFVGDDFCFNLMRRGAGIVRTKTLLV